MAELSIDAPAHLAGTVAAALRPSRPMPAFARLHGWGPTAPLPYASVREAIEHQAALRPGAPAVEHLGQTLSYGDLNRLASGLAQRLRASGLGRGDRAGVFLQRGLPMVVAILAVLKTGAAYVPQDPGIVPPALLRQVMDSAGMQLLLSSSAFAGTLPLRTGETLFDVEAWIASAAGEMPANASFEPSRPEDLCFVLYTSGTTGHPNGVMVSHRNVCNIIHTAPGSLGMGPGRRVGQVLNIGFDMAAWEILGALSHGATLVLRGKDIAETAATLDVLIATPSVLARLDPRRCPRMLAVALAGEPCPRPLAEAWAARCALYLGCGPTEVTIVNTLSRYQPGAAVLAIGRPTPNNTVYLLNEQMQACAVGEIGEMWAGGDCVSAGYIGNPTLTAERYKPDPYLGGERMMFRTRDLARWHADGQLEHMGRVDDQVKVRGFRVELDAVSVALERSPGCLRAITLKASERELVAFVSPMGVDPEAARAEVRRALPYYCVPRLVIPLPELPQTERGKVDKRHLLALAQALLAQDQECAA